MTQTISVIVPVYNRTWQLRRALRSLSEQTYNQFEVVVCDDGSSEDIASIVAEFQDSLTLLLVRIPNSGGPARPRNIAARKASGDWLSFLDSDDWWDSHRMEVVAAALREDVDLVYHSLRLIGADGRARRRGLSKKVGFPIRGEPLRHMALFGNPIPTSASLVRRRIFEHIGGMSEDPKLVAFEDFDAWLRLVERGARIHFIDEILGSYWIGDDSISAMSERQIYRQIELFNRHVSYFSAFEKAAQARQYYTIGSMWGQIKGQSEVAREHLSRAKALPTFAMRIKRLFKYIKLTF